MQGRLPTQLSSSRWLRVLLQHNVINTPSIMVRMEATRHVLPLLQTHWKYAQDWLLWILLAADGQDLLWDPEPLHQYRIHGESLSSVPDKAALRRAEIRLVPLCALSAASGFSAEAAALWKDWRSLTLPALVATGLCVAARRRP